MDKAAERTQILLEFGRLFAELHKLANSDVPPTSAQYRIASARLQRDSNQWRDNLRAYFTVGSLPLINECQQVLNSLTLLHLDVSGFANFDASTPNEIQQQLRTLLSNYEKRIVTQIDAFPIEWESKLLSDKSPFSAYLAIRDAINTATKRIHYFDRYLDADFFPRYLRGIDRSIEIKLITTTGENKPPNPKRQYGVVAVQSIAQLVAGEFANFQLIECSPSDMHDRNLRVDDTIFHLGPSMADAGHCPTNFNPADSSPAAHKTLDGIITKGSVVPL